MFGEKQIKAATLKMLKHMQDDEALMKEMYMMFMSKSEVKKEKIEGGIKFTVSNFGEKFMEMVVTKEDFD